MNKDVLPESARLVEITGNRLSFETQNLAVLYHILALFTSRIARGASNEDLSTWIVVDEAQRLFRPKRRNSARWGR